MTHFVKNGRTLATQAKVSANAKGLSPLSANSFNLPDVRSIIQATQEERPDTLHHWIDKDGDLYLCANWYGNSQGEPFLTLYAKAD